MSNPDTIQRPQHGQLLDRIAKLYEKLTARLDEVEAKLKERQESDETPPQKPK